MAKDKLIVASFWFTSYR